MVVPDAVHDLLSAAHDPSGRGVLPWCTAPLVTARRGIVISGGTGTADDPPVLMRALASTAPGGPRFGPPVRTRPNALPLADAAVDGILLLLVLPVLPRLDDVFAELRRVLRPAATLVVVVPSARLESWAELRARRVTGRVHRSWRHRSALDRTDWLLAAADFAVVEQHRVGFVLPLPDPATAHRLATELPVSGLWPRGSDRQRAVQAGLAGLAGPTAVLPVPLRRLVARR